jgi:hypothetical protein
MAYHSRERRRYRPPSQLFSRAGRRAERHALTLPHPAPGVTLRRFPAAANSRVNL